ncbi:MAG: hypothetical protein ABIP75_05540 [Pyrinomonadaceae bacterium]
MSEHDYQVQSETDNAAQQAEDEEYRAEEQFQAHLAAVAERRAQQAARDADLIARGGRIELVLREEGFIRIRIAPRRVAA